MLPYEIELILYAAPLVTLQANLMPLFMRIIFPFLLSFNQCFCELLLLRMKLLNTFLGCVQHPNLHKI